MAGYGTKELDLEGKVVVPGFIDSHVHFISGGLQVLYKLVFDMRNPCELTLYALFVSIFMDADDASGTERCE